MPRRDFHPQAQQLVSLHAIHCCFVDVVVELKVSSIVSRQWYCAHDIPLPSFGSRWPRFPAVISTMRMLRLPDLRPFDLFVRQPVPWCPAGGLCLRLRAPAIRAETDDGPGSIVFCRHSLSGRLSPTDRAGSPRFPGELSCGYASVLRPRMTRGASPFAALPVLPPQSQK